MERIDPKEAGLLCDIVALILDENEGGAQAALYKIKQKAKTNKITGGALKNAFAHLLGNQNHGSGNVNASEAQFREKSSRAAESISKLTKTVQKQSDELALLHLEITKSAKELNDARDRETILSIRLETSHNVRLGVAIAGVIGGLFLGIAISGTQMSKRTQVASASVVSSLRLSAPANAVEDAKAQSNLPPGFTPPLRARFPSTVEIAGQSPNLVVALSNLNQMGANSARPLPDRHWPHVTPVGTRWRLLPQSNPAQVTLYIDLGSGHIAIVKVGAPFLRLPPLEMADRVDFAQSTIIRQWGRMSGNYEYSQEGTISATSP